jgi:hypothetical protein
VYRYRGKFYAFHEAGMDGPFDSFDQAVHQASIDEVTGAIVEIWRIDKGLTFERS